jgi:hypothetical protein
VALSELRIAWLLTSTVKLSSLLLQAPNVTGSITLPFRQGYASNSVT